MIGCCSHKFSDGFRTGDVSQGLLNLGLSQVRRSNDMSNKVYFSPVRVLSELFKSLVST